MTQYDWGTINPATKSGSALASDLDSYRTASNSGHRGASRPSYVVAGMRWVKVVSGTTEELYFYDGADDILLGTVNPTTNVFTPYLGPGSVPASAISAGSGSGLDADKLDSLHATSFVRTDASSTISTGFSIRFNYTYSLDSNDGRFGMRTFARGLNIVGGATENGDSTRYITAYGNTDVQGALYTTGAMTSDGVIQAKGARLETNTSAPMVLWRRPSGGSGAFGWAGTLSIADDNLYFTSGVDSGGAGGTNRAYIGTSGKIWTQAWGLLDAYFAQRATLGGQGSPRVYGSGGTQALASGYEVYDTGDGRHQVRQWVQNCTNCAVCDCDCAGGD